MQARVLIVEDEILVAADMVAALEDLGHLSAGIAPDTETALALADEADPDLALVDLNLRDGSTGARIGALLSQRGIDVLFVTANPRMLDCGVPGTVGVMCKPCDDECLAEAITFLLRRRRGEVTAPPKALSLFSRAS